MNCWSQLHSVFQSMLSAFLTGFSDLPLPPGDQQAEGGIPLFYNAVYQGQNMRMVALRFLVAERSINGWMEIHVAKTTGNRKAFILDAVTRSATRILIVVALGGDWPWAGTTGDAARGHYQAIIP